MQTAGCKTNAYLGLPPRRRVPRPLCKPCKSQKVVRHQKFYCSCPSRFVRQRCSHTSGSRPETHLGTPGQDHGQAHWAVKASTDFGGNGVNQDLTKFKRFIRSSTAPRLLSLPPPNKLGSRLTCFHHHPRSPNGYKFTVSSDSWGWECSELWSLASAAQIPASD